MLLIDSFIFCKSLLFVRLLGQQLSSSDEIGTEIGAINSVFSSLLHLFWFFIYRRWKKKVFFLSFFSPTGMVTYSRLTRHQEVWNSPFENPIILLNCAVKTQNIYPIKLTLLSLLIHLVGSRSCILLTDLHICSWARLIVTYLFAVSRTRPLQQVSGVVDLILLW